MATCNAYLQTRLQELSNPWSHVPNGPEDQKIEAPQVCRTKCAAEDRSDRSADKSRNQWEKYAGVIRVDLEVKCPVCQDYIGLLSHICPGMCACKYHIGCFWPAPSRRSVCTVCKAPFASKTYEFFNTRHIPPASKGSINLDTGELELDADQALDNEIHADVMAGRRDSFGPNNVDRARQSEDKKLWKRFVHKFLQIWHHG
ncbi:hypothetical protein R1sor_006044 [Riccia sorocarpa]|uniref:RING-type domain-containing protein n=1 Tax=Riccia sorocarpa TaxID=122646 RepID=A0ABD3HLU3_9MARC